MHSLQNKAHPPPKAIFSNKARTIFRKKNKRSLLFFFVFSLIHGSSGAAETPFFSLTDAFHLAKKNDTQVLAALTEITAQEEQGRLAKAQLLPQITLTSGIEIHRQETRTPGFVPFNDNFNTEGFNVQLNHPLFNLSNIDFLEQKHIDSEIAKIQYFAAEQDLIYQVASNYFDVMISQESMTTVNAQMKAMTQLYGQANTAYRNGNADQIDVDEIRSSMDLLRSQSVITRNDLEIKKHRLLILTGDFPAKLAKNLNKKLDTPLSPSEMSSWEKEALRSSLTLNIAKLNLYRAKKQVHAEKSEHYPTLDLVLSHGQSIRNDDHSLETTAALQLELPLYQGGATSAQIREAQAYEEKTKYLLQDTTKQVLLSVREAFLEAKNGRLLTRSANQALISSQKLLDSTYSAFDNGIRGSLDVLNAQLGLFESQREKLRSEYNFLTSILKLKLMAGVLAPEDLSEIDRLLNLATTNQSGNKEKIAYELN